MLRVLIVACFMLGVDCQGDRRLCERICVSGGGKVDGWTGDHCFCRYPSKNPASEKPRLRMLRREVSHEGLRNPLP